MLGRSHIIVGSCSLANLAAGVSFAADRFGLELPAMEFGPRLVGLSAVGLVLYLLGNLAPDLDRYMPIEHHRMTHSVYCLVPFLFLGLLHPVCLMFAFGYFMHLLWDSSGRCGVCWFNPFTGYKRYPDNKKIKKGHYVYLYHTGEFSEKVVMLLYVLASVVWCIWVFGPWPR